jgi:hypothetical protein
MNTVGRGFPQRPVGLDQGFDLRLRQFKTQVAQRGKRLERLASETDPEILIGEQPTDQQLNRLL